MSITKPVNSNTEEYNLLGQKIGNKGRQVRERILEAARQLMQAQPTSIPTLTAITDKAEVKISIIYRYYRDVGALLLDAMQPLQDEMAPLLALLDQPWKNEKQYECAMRFAREHYKYWKKRKGALFARNSLADGGDARFVSLRTEWAVPLFYGLAKKIATTHSRENIELDLPVAGLLISGMERTTTVSLQNALHSGKHQSVTTIKTFVLGEKQVCTSVAQLITHLLRHDHLYE